MPMLPWDAYRSGPLHGGRPGWTPPPYDPTVAAVDPAGALALPGTQDPLARRWLDHAQQATRDARSPYGGNAVIGAARRNILGVPSQALAPIIPPPRLGEREMSQPGASVGPLSSRTSEMDQAPRAFGSRDGLNPDPQPLSAPTDPGFRQGAGQSAVRSDPEIFLQGLVDRAAFDIGSVQPAQRLLQEEIRPERWSRRTWDYPRTVPPPERRQPNRFGSRPPTFRDRMFEKHMYNAARLARTFRGDDDAARYLRHFLDGHGTPLNPNLRGMIREIPEFRDEVNRNLRGTLRAEIERRLAEGARGSFLVETPWQLAQGAPEGNWQIAHGGFNFAHTAHVRAVPRPDGSLEVTAFPTLHVFDRYDWRPGQSTRVVNGSGLGRFVPRRLRTVEDADMAALVEAGLAREFEIRGSLRQSGLRWTVDGSRPRRRGSRR